MRISSPHHARHYIRHAMREVFSRTKVGDRVRLQLESGEPVFAEITKWETKAGVGTWLYYKELASGVHRSFSWMDPGAVVDVQYVDSSPEGLDFAGVASQVAKRAAQVAKRERAKRLELAQALESLAKANAKTTAVLKILANRLAREKGKKQAAAVLLRLNARAERALTKAQAQA